jgi:4-phosphopantoate--beta-alanine ligase
MKVPASHPRYKSLKTREELSQLSDEGVVARTGLIAHGRGEAFDYMLGERTRPFAVKAAIAAAAHLLLARNPVLSVNGNVAALAGKEMIAMSRAIPAKLEVNLFHRSRARIERVVTHMERLGAKVLVPLEDGDRAEALVRMGKTVIAVDLNPLSRTAKTATVTIVDELTRALPNVTEHVKEMKGWPEARLRRLADGFDNVANLKKARRAMAEHVMGR